MAVNFDYTKTHHLTNLDIGTDPSVSDPTRFYVKRKPGEAEKIVDLKLDKVAKVYIDNPE